VRTHAGLTAIYPEAAYGPKNPTAIFGVFIQAITQVLIRVRGRLPPGRIQRPSATPLVGRAFLACASMADSLGRIKDKRHSGAASPSLTRPKEPTPCSASRKSLRGKAGVLHLVFENAPLSKHSHNIIAQPMPWRGALRAGAETYPRCCYRCGYQSTQDSVPKRPLAGGKMSFNAIQICTYFA
jgi:hypothetical protein